MSISPKKKTEKIPIENLYSVNKLSQSCETEPEPPFKQFKEHLKIITLWSSSNGSSK